MCSNLSVDDSFEPYKNKIGTRIAEIIGESLMQGAITEEQSEEIGAYILGNIDLAKTNSELLDFVTNLSAKWPIFNSLLTPDSQVPTNVLPPVQSQEKTDEIVHAAEDLIKENKIEEALQVAKAATDNTGQNPPIGTGGGT